MAVTVQMQFESVVTELYEDAFVGSSIENGATIITFDLRQRDFHQELGATATLYWRKEAYHVDIHELSTFHNPIKYRFILAHGYYLDNQNQRLYFTPAIKGVSTAQHIPTVSPAKNSLVYSISIAYIDHPVWGRHRKEAKRGPPSGHRITGNGVAMVSLLLPYATTGVSLIAGWCVIGVTPRGEPRTPVLCTFRRPFMGRPVPRQLMRNALLDLTTIVPATACQRRSYADRYSRYRAIRASDQLVLYLLKKWLHPAGLDVLKRYPVNP